jgi:predicted ATPase
MRADTPLKEVPVLPHDGSELAAFYNTIRAASVKQFQSFERTLSSIVPTARGVHVAADRSGILSLEVEESDVAMSSRVVSEGTLRILGLLAVTNPLEPLSLVGYEEPENGIHPDRLSAVGHVLLSAAQRGGTQYIVNTHSPILPECFLGQEPAQLIRCSRRDRHSVFEPLQTPDLFSNVEADIGKGLQEGRELVSNLNQRLVRGDFR